jgi:hypothetical protein
MEQFATAMEQAKNCKRHAKNSTIKSIEDRIAALEKKERAVGVGLERAVAASFVKAKDATAGGELLSPLSHCMKTEELGFLDNDDSNNNQIGKIQSVPANNQRPCVSW